MAINFHMKLPRSKREFLLFLGVISIISVNLIAPLVTCFELGFRLQVWRNMLPVIPLIWAVVLVLVPLTYKPAQWLTGRLVKHGDSFSATVTINILCSVFLLSIFLTVVGRWIGSGQVDAAPFLDFFYKWPRNFAIALGVELLIAQPIARFVMLKYHHYIDGRKGAGEDANAVEETE